MKPLGRSIRRRRAVLIAAALMAAIVVAFALGRVIEFIGRQSAGPNTVATVPPQSFAFSFYDRARAVPEIRFVDREGHAFSLADFRDRPVLLNIWATTSALCHRSSGT